MGDTKQTQKTSWFKGVKAEFKKIVWPDQKSLTKQTIAVVSTSVALALIIKILDMIMTMGIDILVTL
ncbi:MAG: preprotein translocase subunit SecE [Lachnospiraceae bacterium]|jgi:preprotein translocase subunit SecE|nr:preprotein translocase subunit SecE [Lachnospiraceae bacterium]